MTIKTEQQAELICEGNDHIERIEKDLEEKKAEILIFSNTSENQNEVMEDLRCKVEELQEQLESQQDIRPTSNKAEGSYYALQVAYGFIQKQLKQFKSENEELRKTRPQEGSLSVQEGAGEHLQKENSDLKLRLKFGKQAFETKFKECEKLKGELSLVRKKHQMPDLEDNTTQDLKEENIQLQSEVVALKEELLRKNGEAANLSKENNDDHKLTKEENKLLKAQVSALLEGVSTATIRRKFDPSTNEVIYQAPSSVGPGIAYPPSMNKIDRDRSSWTPSSDSNPPPNQMIPNRYSQPTAPITQSPVASLTLHGRGNVPRRQEASNQCPVCKFDFPRGYSEATASAHVNSHFQE